MGAQATAGSRRIMGILELPPDQGDVEGPPLPLGRRIDLPDRGVTFVREVAGPVDAPTLLLLHGWWASGGLNWFQAFEPLSEHFNIVAPDLRGHGRGIRSRRRFRLADCADDTAALLDELGTGPVIAVGYSMGGPVSQLLWQRHGDKVDGLVLCATSHGFVPGMRERFIFTTAMASLAGTTRLGQLATHLPTRLVERLAPAWAGQWPGPSGSTRPSTLQRWAAAEMRRHDITQVMEAGIAVGNYNAKRWIGDIDVPTSVVLTELDKAIVPERQQEMADAIPGARVFPVPDGHVACARSVWIPGLVDACRDVADRLH
jgi:pimeloyl-ACP methyl ester carboxylesterase